jgi:hypothetical protein
MTVAPAAPDQAGRAVHDKTSSGETDGLGFAKTAFIALTSMTAATSLLGCPVVGRSEFGTPAPILRSTEQPTWIPWAGELWSPVAAAADSHAVAAPDVRSDQEEILWVKENSGLTWDQLGKVFGVSRRAVHLWANGGRMNEANAEVLRRFASDVATHLGGTAEQTRAALLAHDVVDTFRRAQVRGAGDSIGAPFAPEEKVENVRGVEAAEA